MVEYLQLTDLYRVVEDRFRETTTYKTRYPIDSRWSLVVSLSTKDVFFTDYYKTKEISLKPQPFIILTDNERIELRGEIVKQKYETDTHEVYDGSKKVKKVVPELDGHGNIEKYSYEYGVEHKSHFEQSNYMVYEISYAVSTSELKKIASVAKIECLLHNEELCSEDCQSILLSAKAICYLLGDVSYKKDLLLFIQEENTQLRKKEYDRRKEEAKKKKEAEILKQRQAEAQIGWTFCLLGLVLGLGSGLLALCEEIDWFFPTLFGVMFVLGILLMIDANN